MRSYITKPCFQCKNTYQTRCYSQKFCGAECRKDYWKDKNKAFCSKCGAVIDKRNASGLCQRCFLVHKTQYGICAFCGNQFKATGGRGKKFCSQRCLGGYFNAKENVRRAGKKTWKKFKRPISYLWDEKWLRHQYIDLKKSSPKIARELGTSFQTVQYWLKGHNIDTSYKAERHPRWKNRTYIYDGYSWIKNDEGKPQQEHRYKMEKHLGRKLLRSEIVHHIDGNPLNNNINNLRLVSRQEHTGYTSLCKDCSLRKEVRLLRWQIKELNEKLMGIPGIGQVLANSVKKFWGGGE